MGNDPRREDFPVRARHSLRFRLPVLISALLAAVVVTLLWAAYREVETTLMNEGGERAQTAANQVATLLEQPTPQQTEELRRIATNADLRAYVQNPTAVTRAAALTFMASLARVGPRRVELWNTRGSRLLEFSVPGRSGDGRATALPSGGRPLAAGLSALQAADGVVFTEATVELTTEALGITSGSLAAPPGYVLIRATFTITPPGAISRLVGRNAMVTIGNRSGGVWTDFSRMIPPPLVDQSKSGVSEFRDAEGKRHLGAIARIRGTPWATWVEFPTDTIAAPVRRFVQKMVWIALVFVVVGTILAWVLSAHITKPLLELSQAARQIAIGDYSHRVGEGRPDEIGALGHAFHTMSQEVQRVQGVLKQANDQTQAALSAEREAAKKMSHLAQYDVLTDLPNRTLLDDRITQAVALAHRDHTRLAVLFVDLDRFKHINDSLGHAMGDALLKSVAARLQGCVRASDTVSRHGGDEFVVLLSRLQHDQDAGWRADKVLSAISVPNPIANHVLHATASVGISIYPDDGHGAEELLNAADTAMYHAKENGRNSYQFFTSHMNALAVARRSLDVNLRQALERDEFTLHYQPKFQLETARMTGVEALLRWHHPTRGLVAPGEFVAIAEECGLILPIGRWVLAEACRQARAWQSEGLLPGAMAVNVSAIEFRAKGFLENVAAVLDETGLPPGCLEFEVTESVLMAQAESTTVVLRALKDLGIHLAIDDFGTGYSSLSYLSRFPIDTLKIDRSFVHGMTVAGHDATIINAIIGMGRSLNQRVVAEGVETDEQMALLRTQLCGEGQGFYFSPPVPANELAALLRQQTAG